MQKSSALINKSLPENLKPLDFSSKFLFDTWRDEKDDMSARFYHDDGQIVNFKPFVCYNPKALTKCIASFVGPRSHQKHLGFFGSSSKSNPIVPVTELNSKMEQLLGKEYSYANGAFLILQFLIHIKFALFVGYVYFQGFALAGGVGKSGYLSIDFLLEMGNISFLQSVLLGYFPGQSMTLMCSSCL